MQDANIAVTPDNTFDWDAYERTCPKYRRENKKFNNGSLVYSDDPKTMELYDLMIDSISELKIPRQQEIVKGKISSVSGRYAYKKEEIVEGSYTEVVKHLKYREIFENIGKPIAFSAYVKQLIHGGYFLDIQGVEVFMPGSLGGVNKLVNFDSLLGQTIAGDGKTGFITGTTKFGVFCEFDQCLTGLIHKSDLDDDTKELFDNRNLKPGDSIDFTVKEITKDKRIILTQKEFVPEIDPWEDIKERYKIPSQVQGTIRKKTKYGMFIELEPKVVGLLHVSDIPDYIDITTNKEGDTITVDLVKIDTESKKIFFKI